MIIAIFNNKGGVGKTTTAVNVAAALAGGLRTAARVLLVDLDAQASASLSLGVPRAELGRSVALALYGEAPLADLIRPTSLHGLDLVPGDMRLADADVRLSPDKDRRAHLLAALLKPLRARYDWIVLDAPPSLSLPSLNALTAADGVIVPVAPEYLALEGLVNVLEALERMRDGMGISPPLLGILLTRVDYRTRAAKEISEMVRRRFGAQVFETEVRGSVALTEAPSFGKSILEYAPRSRGAWDYRAVAREIILRVKKSQRSSGKKSRRSKGK